MGIAVTAGVIALVVFVVLLLFGGGDGPGYEFEDYEAPPAQTSAPDEIWIPDSEEEALQLLQNNPAYAAVTPDNVNCEMAVIDPMPMTPEQLQDHFNNLSACLMRVWERPMTDAGVTIFRPHITVYTSDMTTACGTKPGDEPNAFYCPADQMLYYNHILHSHPATTDVGATPLGPETVMAHEFAHFLQGRTGVIGAYAYLRYYEESSEVQLEMSRRNELQADCWAGMWVRANTSAMDVSAAGVEGLSAMFGGLGDGSNPQYRDHGSGPNRQQWFLDGTGTNSVGSCNTWTADEQQVS